MTKKQFAEKANRAIQEWVKDTVCPLCLGIDSTMNTHPSLGPFTAEFSLPDGVVCNKAGHKLSAIGVNNPEFALISLMSVSKRPTRKEEHTQ